MFGETDLLHYLFIVKVPSGLQPHHMQCTQSKVYTGSKLLGGNDAGKFTHVGKVGKMHICSRQCCEDQNCDLAYVFSVVNLVYEF